ncbi:uncharacterized protein LOC141655117 [Silene latifolia]|uniref:uncharacterized protein LOC141655117 n=1 Tax=Silene latifolia TaxID=37657 RepID=UPI003D76AD6E
MTIGGHRNKRLQVLNGHIIFGKKAIRASFRNKSVDKWQRKADVHSGAAAKKAKLLAFNQNISDQVETYMRDPSKMIRGMQMRRETADVFGSAAQQVDSAIKEPELL